ncbi:hypothetical protein AAFF_G00088200 [Aldrovandia affinis]|uniref:Uncharacterized protein n=1 Tax=Aldrovandia affinis TaxID=143900 RepID=A0AAD7WCB8_9TELE|nr:hypothetical protein AAFF_G00088200 [Aldrovandia affinis]
MEEPARASAGVWPAIPPGTERCDSFRGDEEQAAANQGARINEAGALGGSPKPPGPGRRGTPAFTGAGRETSGEAGSSPPHTANHPQLYYYRARSVILSAAEKRRGLEIVRLIGAVEFLAEAWLPWAPVSRRIGSKGGSSSPARPKERLVSC